MIHASILSANSANCLTFLCADMQIPIFFFEVFSIALVLASIFVYISLLLGMRIAGSAPTFMFLLLQISVTRRALSVSLKTTSSVLLNADLMCWWVFFIILSSRIVTGSIVPMLKVLIKSRSFLFLPSWILYLSGFSSLFIPVPKTILGTFTSRQISKSDKASSG